MPKIFSDFFRIGVLNRKYLIKIDVDLFYQLGDLVINDFALNIDVAAPDAVVSCATAFATGI
ncbi:MAG: hypothetical protein CL607_04940 [Anaerolineaceae bacterium]|nr:hypothetical protein [Anaerolineaceae bacterium]